MTKRFVLRKFDKFYKLSTFFLPFWIIQHNVEVAIGTGLRYDIWPEVAPRFGDMWMWELYGKS